MRNLILLFFLLICVSGFAQNAFFISFGQTEKDVNDFLQTKDYIWDVPKIQEGRLVNQITDRQQITYCFKDQILYAVEDQRIYKSKRDASRSVESCVDFLRKLDKNNKVAKIGNDESKEHYVAVTDDKIFELIVEFGKKEKSSVVLFKSTSRNHGPRMQTEAFIASLN